ncbi:hypothetical protein ACIRQY_06740 [Streptomyces sp. NPDC101490]|uniref:hypothetical protein n=1 Tax=Streptomyces sp. NPDC101490 TaxID=3366143 RepID=UPI00382A7683
MIAMSGPVEGRTYARMVRVSVLALALQGALFMVLGVVFGEAGRPAEDGSLLSPLQLFGLPFVTLLGLLAAVVVSAAVVLPAVLGGEGLARKAGGCPIGWQLTLAGAAGALLVPFAGWWAWPVGAAVLAVTVLLTRPARRGWFVRLLYWGTLAVLGTLALGGVGLSTGVIAA